MERHILILSYFTNAGGMACSHHIDDRLSALEQQGRNPIVLSSFCVPRHHRFKHYRIFSLSPSGIRFEIRYRFKEKIRQHRYWKIVRDLLLLPLLPLYALERLFRRLDPTWYWQTTALILGIWICLRFKVDTVYSTGGPAVAHSVGRNLSRIFGLRWIAEVQDPLIHGYCARHDCEFEKLLQVERQTYTESSAMIFLTHQALEQTAKRVQDAGKGKVIYPGAHAIKHTVPVERAAGPLRFAHFGSLGGARNLRTFLAGLEIAVDSRGVDPAAVRINLFGNVGDDDLQRIQASHCGDMFRLHGLIGRAQALEEMTGCDMLLLIQGDHDISKETIPSKCYEYFLSGVPILGLIHQNRELHAMFDHLGHKAVAADQPGQIAEALDWVVSKGGPVDMALKESPYTVDRAVQQLLAL